MNNNFTNHIPLVIPFLFGLWLVVKPSGFQGFLNFQFELMRKLKMVPKGFNSQVRLSQIKVFGFIWIAIWTWVIVRLLAGTLP
jgi:hypothetical protein